MQQTTQILFPSHSSPSGQCLLHPQPVPSFQDKLGMLSPQLQHEPAKSRESLLQQPAKDKTAPHLIPRLRAMVKSQAFKNILVDEMDMMLSRAATLIQANWRGYRLRQKLVSQMLAAKAIQEAWRRFNTRRILRSSKAVVKKTDAEEGDIPYHRPQQVRFQYPEENRLLCQPLTLNKETQFPSSDRLAHLQPCAAQGTPEAGMQAPHAAGTPGATFLPHQTVTMKLSCPVSLDTKRQPCLVTRTFRNACLSHAEGDTVKTSHVTAGTNKTGAPEPPVAGRYGQEVSRSFKTQAQTQAHVEAEILKAPSQMYPVVSITNTPPQMYLVSTMTNTSAQTCPVPTMTKTPPRMCPVVSVAKTPAQTYPVPTMTKTPPQTCPVSTIIKTPAQTCQVPVMTKTPARVRPTASITSNPSQTRPAAVTAKILPQVCLLASMIKPPSKTRPVVAMTKTTPQMCVVPAMVKTTPQMRPAATTTKSPLQKCLGATMAKTSSQTCPVTSMTKPPPQARLAAMITKTPAQIRSVAAVLRTLCSATPEAANLKSPPQAAVAAGTSNTLSHMHLNVPKAKATVNTKQAVGTVKVSSHSYLSEANVKWLPQPRLVSGAPKAPAKPPLDAEKIKACLQKQVKAETIPKTNVAAGMLRPSTWIKAAEERNKPPSQAHVRMDVIKVQSQVYMPMETAVVLPQAQLAVPLTKATSQARPPAQQTSTLSQAQLGTCLTKASSQAHAPAQQTSALSQAQLATLLMKASSQGRPHTGSTKTQAQLGTCPAKAPSQIRLPIKLTKAPSLAHLVTCLTKAQSQAQLVAGAMKVPSRVHLPTGLVKTQSQAQLVTDKAKGLCTAHQSVELSSKTHSQPLLTGSEASTHACLHIGAKLDNRPTQLHPHSHGQDKATQGLRPVAPESQGMLVPLSAPTGHPTCNDSWGDSGTTRAQPSMPSQVAPCQDDATAFQLASLCAELAMVLGSQEDLRALLAKALSQTEVRAALNQALSKEILGTTVAKALPQGILGMVLVKALSWGELGITLSRALSRGELQAELTKAMQGRLAEVLSKALTDEERAALSQALCQGELGAVLSQSLSQAALRTAAKLPKADSKTAGSRMTMVPAPVEVDHRGSPLAACRPVKPQPSKVRFSSQVGAWEGFALGQHVGPLEEMGDGATSGGLLCSSMVSVGVSLTGTVVGSTNLCPLMTGLDPMPTWGTGDPGRGFSCNLYASPKVRKENWCLALGAGEVASDFHPLASGEGPNLPQPPHLQPPPSLWQLLIANGMGPSTSRSSVAHGMSPSSHKPQAVSTVAPCSWTSSREGGVASGAVSGSAGSGRATHCPHQSSSAGGGSTPCQHPGVSRLSPKLYQPAAARGPRQPSRASEGSLQRKTQPPSHKQGSQGTRETINKGIPNPSQASPRSQVQAAKTWVDRSLFPGSLGRRLAQVLPRMSTPGQERAPTQRSVSTPPCSRELATGRQMSILSELMSSVPQGSENVLARSVCQDSMAFSLNESHSFSSLPSYSSHSLSTTSAASLTTVNLVEEESCEGNLDEDLQLESLLSRESMGRLQRLEDMKETEKAGHRHRIPILQHQPFTDSELIPVLQHSSMCSDLALSVHWSSESEMDKFPSEQSSMNLIERLAKSTFRTGMRKSLSLDTVVPTIYREPSVATGLAPSASQPTVVNRVAPNLGQSSGASRVYPTTGKPSVAGRLTLSLSQPPASSKVSPGLANPSKKSGVALNLAHTSTGCGVTPNSSLLSVARRMAPSLGYLSGRSEMSPSLGHPSMTTGVSPSLTQPSMTTEVFPSLDHPSMTTGVSLSLTQPSMASGVSRSLSLPPMVNGVSPILPQQSMTSGMTPSLGFQSMANGVSPSLGHPSMTTGVSSNLVQPFMTTVVSPNLGHPSMTTGVAPILAQPLITTGVSPSLFQPSVPSGMSPSLTQPSMTTGMALSLGFPPMVSGVSPSLGYPSVSSEMSPSLAQPSMITGVSPNLAQPSIASGMSPSLAQPSMTSRVSPSLAQPSVTSGVTPCLAQPSVASGVTPCLAQPSVPSGVTPHLAQPSVVSGVSPRLAQPSVPSGVSPSLAQPTMTNVVSPSLGDPSITSGVSSSLAQQSMTTGVSPSLVQPSVPSGVSPRLAQPSVSSGVSPSLSQPSVPSGVTPSLGPPFVPSGVSPSLAQPTMTNVVSPSLGHPSITSGVSSSLAQQSMTTGVSPSLAQPSVPSGVTPRLGPSSVPSGVSPSLAQPFVPSGMSPSLAQPSVVSGVFPSLAQPSMTNVVSPSLGHPSITSGVSSSLAQQSMTTGVSPSLAQPSVPSGVSPRLAQLSVPSGVSPRLAQPSVSSGVSPSLSQPSVPSGVTPSLGPPSVPSGVSPSLAQPSVPSGVSPSLAQPSVVSGVFPSLAQPSMTNVVSPSLGHPSITSGVSSSLAQQSMTTGVSPSLAQPSVPSGVSPNLHQRSMTTAVSPSLGHPSMTSGMAPSFAHPSLASGVIPTLARPWVSSVVAPVLGQPSVSSGVFPNTPLSSMIAQTSMASGVAPSLGQTSTPSEFTSRLDQPAMVSWVAPTLSQSPMASRGTFSPAQPSVARWVASCLAQPSVLSGVGKGLSPPGWGPGADSSLQSSRESTGAPHLCPPSIFISVSACQPYPCVASGMGQGSNQPSLGTGVDPREDPLMVTGVVSNLQDSGFREVSFGFHQPPSVGGRYSSVCQPSVVTVSVPNLCQASVANEEDCGLGQGSSVFQGTLFQGAAMGMPQGPVAASVFLSMSQGAVCDGVAGHLPGRRTATCVGQSQSQVASGTAPMAAQILGASAPLIRGVSVATGVGPSLPPASVPTSLAKSQSNLSLVSVGPSISQVNVAALGTSDPILSSYQPANVVPQGSVLGMAGSGLKPGSVARRMNTARAPGAVVSGMAPVLPPGSVIRGVGQNLSSGYLANGGAQSLPPGSGASRVADSLTAADRQSLSARPSASVVAPSQLPDSVMSGVDLSVPLGSMATVGASNRAQSLPQGSMLIGITPRPYYGATAGEGSTVPGPASHGTGLNQVYPQASGASGTARRVSQVPTVLSRAFQLSQELGMTPPEATEGWDIAKSGELDEALSHVSGSSSESTDLTSKSRVLGATPWIHHGAMGMDVDYDHRPQFEEETLPKAQMECLVEVAPSQASGEVPVSFQPLSLAKDPMASSITPTLQPQSITSSRVPSSHLMAESGQICVGDTAMSQPVAPGPTEAPSTLMQESMAHVGPQSHSQGMVASTEVSGSPQLAWGSTVASSVHLGSVARMETPSPPQRSSMVSHVLPSLATKAASSPLQMEAVPTALQKPVSGNQAQSNRESLGPKKSFRSMHRSTVPEMLEGSVARVVPSHQVQKHASWTSLVKGKQPSSAPPVGITPILHTSEAARGTTIPKLSLGVRRVSIGYESSPSGSRRPLFDQESKEGIQDSPSSGGPVVSQKASLIPFVLQGPKDAGMAGGQSWNSAVHSVMVRPMDHAAVAPCSARRPARGAGPWDAVGSKVSADPRQPGKLTMSVQTVEEIIVQAVITLQACMRGYLVRRTIKVWHQWATIIQATWRGYCVRRKLTHLYRATTVIQAAWRGYCTRRDRAQQMLLPGTWAELGSSRARTTSEHRCYQSCQPHVCSLCQSLSTGLGSPPSVVMLVGSSPRTCHMCGHTLPTRVVQGVGQGGGPWACVSQLASQSSQQLRHQIKAATVIQSAWRGFKIRRQLKQQQVAAKMVQATWRGHHTRTCLTTDALLGPASPWNSSRHTYWPGV